MSQALDAAKLGLVVFVAAIVQVSVVSSFEVAGGVPDVLLVALVVIALLRGAVVGAVAGFVAGVLVDTATLQTLGLTSFLLTLAGYWAGRYAETSGRGRAHAPVVAVAAITVLYAVGGLVLHFVLGGEVSPRRVLIDMLLPTLLLNLVLTTPLHAVLRRLLRQRATGLPAREVRLLG